MRTYKDFDSIRLRTNSAHIADLAHPQFLTTARYEAVFRERLGAATVDLLFEREEEALVVHAVLIDMIALATTEGLALVWPVRYDIVDDVAHAIEFKLTPWLRTLVRGRTATGEYVRSFAPSKLFDAARAHGFRGAAPYAQTLVASSPFVYARRFVGDSGVVRIQCGDPYHAASVLHGAPDIEIIEPGDDNERIAWSRRWYGVPEQTIGNEPDVVICDALDDYPSARVAVATRASEGAFVVTVPQPVPFDQMFTFDPADAPAASTFSVRAADRVSRPIRSDAHAQSLGGSGGRIAFVLRDDARYAPDADTDTITELARRLEAEGLDIAQTVALDDPVLAAADLIHIFGAVNAAHTYAAIERALQLGKPYIVSLEPVCAPLALYREEGLLAALRLGSDDAERAMYIDAYFAKKLVIDGIPTNIPEDEQRRIDRRFGTACSGASSILLSPVEDVDAFCRRFPEIPAERVRLAGTLVPNECAEAPVAAMIPSVPFALMHGSLVRRTNQCAVLDALASAGVPLVVAAELSDVDLGITARRVSGGAILIPDPSAGAVSALYRRAAVFIDGSERPAGPARIARAAACGMLPLMPYTSPLARLTVRDLLFDLTEPSSIAPVVRAALDRTDARQLAARVAGMMATISDPVTSFQDVVAAYAAVGA